MADEEIRHVHDLKIAIDATLCVSFGDCVEVAPEAFQLDAEGICVFVAPEDVGRARLISACEVCPVDALTVWDAKGQQIVP